LAGRERASEVVVLQEINNLLRFLLSRLIFRSPASRENLQDRVFVLIYGRLNFVIAMISDDLSRVASWSGDF